MIDKIKNEIKRIIRILKFNISVIIAKIKFRNLDLSYQGYRFMDYLSKVIVDNYEPITYEDQMQEKNLQNIMKGMNITDRDVAAKKIFVSLYATFY